MCDKILCASCMEFFWSCASCEECGCVVGDSGTFGLAYEMDNISVFRLGWDIEESDE